MDKDAPAGTSARVTVRRSIPDAFPATGLLDRVFAGPTDAEKGAGLRLVTSGATGFTSLSVAGGIAPGAPDRCGRPACTWSPLALTWIPAQGTFSGWTPVTVAQMREYSGGGVQLRGQPCG